MSARRMAFGPAALGLAILALTTSSAAAQSVEHGVALGAGAVQFDLAGTGTAFGTTLRGTRALSDHVGLEAGLLVSWPAEDVGRSLLLIPEVHLQYHWGAARVRPYAGGGVGAALLDRDLFDSRWNLTLSAAGGVRMFVTERAALFGELRLRGVERDFAGSTAEWTGGLFWRLGRDRP